MKPIRTRIAPSPTGEPHIGLAYASLINMALIKQGGQGGQFILRVEDTDQARSNAASEQSIFECLNWIGITWDEGPDVGGPHGPYRQTERREIYHKYCNQLLAQGHAFKCFCTPERLDMMRALQKKQGKSPKYDGHCLHLSSDDIAKREAAGETPVVRMKVPTEGTCNFTDMVYGPISIPWADVDMQVIMKSDGLPTYHLAVVVDDHLMGITHIVRGDEWISSTPKHIKLYEYFGWDMPPTLHFPVLRNADRTKLSKRKNHTSLRWFQAQGYLPQAMINFLGGFFVKFTEGEEELLTPDEFFKRFDPTAVSKAGPVFDLAKLDWFNGRWMRERLSDKEYINSIQSWATRGNLLEEGLKLARSRITKLSELPALISCLFSGNLGLTKQNFAGLKTTEEQTGAVLTAVQHIADTIPTFTAPEIWNAIKALEEPLGLKAKFITAPLFVAITGKPQGLPLTETMELLGRALCRDRLRTAAALFVTPPAITETSEEQSA